MVGLTLNEPDVVFTAGQVDLASAHHLKGKRFKVSWSLLPCLFHRGSAGRSVGRHSWPLELVKPIALEEQQPAEIGEFENMPTARRDRRFRMVRNADSGHSQHVQVIRTISHSQKRPRPVTPVFR